MSIWSDTSENGVKDQIGACTTCLPFMQDADSVPPTPCRSSYECSAHPCVQWLHVVRPTIILCQSCTALPIYAPRWEFIVSLPYDWNAFNGERGCTWGAFIYYLSCRYLYVGSTIATLVFVDLYANHVVKVRFSTFQLLGYH